MTRLLTVGRLPQEIVTECRAVEGTGEEAVIAGTGEALHRLLDESLRDSQLSRLVAISPDRTSLRRLLRHRATDMARAGRSLNALQLPVGRTNTDGFVDPQALGWALEMFLAPLGAFLVGQFLSLADRAAVRPLGTFPHRRRDIPPPRSAIVIGASAGVGRATALELSRRGFDVGLVARRTRELERVAGEAQGGSAAIAPADVTEPGELTDAFTRLTLELGHPDVMVYAAGIVGGGIQQTESFRKVMDVNFFGFAEACRNYIELCRTGERGGRIVGIGSVSTTDAPLPGVDSYCASKGALLQLVRSLSVGQARRGIAANCVSPGPVRTAMTQDLPEELCKAWTDAIPLGRFATPDEVAHVVACVASDPGSKPLTGQHIYVDGGFRLAREVEETNA